MGVQVDESRHHQAVGNVSDGVALKVETHFRDPAVTKRHIREAVDSLGGIQNAAPTKHEVIRVHRG
jgi:hypothetical protein